MTKFVMMSMITKCWFQNLILSFKVKVLSQSTNAKRLLKSADSKLQKGGSSWEESDEKVTQN